MQFLRSAVLGCVIMGLIALTASAQPVFECQSPAPLLLTGTPDCEGVTGTVNASQNGDPYVSAVAQCGFPTEGSQYLIVPGNNPGGLPAPPIGGPLVRPTPAGYSEVQIMIPAGANDVAITWDWFNGEFCGGSAAFNDGMSIDVIDPAAPGTSLLNIAYADTGSGCAPSQASCSWNSPNATNMNGGTDAIADGSQTTCVALPAGLPPGAILSIVAWSGGDDLFSSAVFIDDIQWNTGCPPVSLPNMPNSGEATLSFTGFNCQPVGTLPLQRIVAQAGETDMTIGSGANGQQNFALFATPGFGAVAGPGIPTPAGVIDFSIAGLTSALTVVIDGFNGGFFESLFGNTGPGGSRTYSISIGTGTGVLATFQALVADPTSAFGATLTAATQVDYLPPAPLPASYVGATPSGASSMTSANLVFSTGFAFPFYGTVWTDVFVNTRGNLTFGAADTGFMSDTATMLTGPPRIAPLWLDYFTSSSAYTETAGDLVVSWSASTFGGETSDFALRIDNLGQITFAYGNCGAIRLFTAVEPLVGISPGAASAVGAATGAPIDLSTQAIGVGYTGAPTEAIFEIFTGTLPGTVDIAPPCGAMVPMGPFGQISFFPNSPMGVPGDTGYLAL